MWHAIATPSPESGPGFYFRENKNQVRIHENVGNHENVLYVGNHDFFWRAGAAEPLLWQS